MTKAAPPSIAIDQPGGKLASLLQTAKQGLERFRSENNMSGYTVMSTSFTRRDYLPEAKAAKLVTGWDVHLMCRYEGKAAHALVQILADGSAYVCMPERPSWWDR